MLAWTLLRQADRKRCPAREIISCGYNRARMPARLIVNADDFGLTAGVNRSVEELHRAGVVTSTTLMATGRAFDDAVAVARRNPALGVGCHLVFTDGVPASRPSEIPTLLGPDGRTFRPSLASFALAALRGKLAAAEIAREAHAQIAALQRAGIRVTHVDTHKHTHLFPAVAKPLLAVLEQLGIRAIRNPHEPGWTRALQQGGWLRRTQLAVLHRLQPQFQRLKSAGTGAVQTTDGTIGISATGDLNERTLHDLLTALPETGTFELVCHPGYNDADLDRVTTRLRTHRETEHNALLACLMQQRSQPNAPRLIHYGELRDKAAE
jgi:hopanoid biosynthesis associated protein HpnK